MTNYNFVFNPNKYSIAQRIQLDRLSTYYDLEDSIEADFSLNDWKELTKNYTVSERVNLILRTFGYEPFNLSFMEKLILLVRIIPFCQKSFNFIELGDKSTGKSSTYQKFSREAYCPTGSLTESKLFGDAKSKSDSGILNNYKVVVFDEISEGSSISPELATKLRSFLADGNTGRNGVNIMNSVSTGFVGNLKDDQLNLLTNPSYKTDLFSFFPEAFRQSPFKDRISFVIPGWHLKFEQFHYLKEPSNKALNINYFMHILGLLREVSLEIKTIANPKDTVRSISHYNATLEGFIKLIYPNEDYTEFELNAMKHISLFGRSFLTNDTFKFFNNDVKKFVLKFIEKDIIHIANKTLNEVDKVYFYENRLHLKFFDEERLYKIPLNRFGRIENEQENELYLHLKEDEKNNFIPILKSEKNYIVQKYSVPSSEHMLFKDWKDVFNAPIKLNLPKEFKGLESTLNSILKHQEAQIDLLKQVIKEQSKTITELQNEVHTYNDNLEDYLRQIKLDLLEHDYFILLKDNTYPKQHSNFFNSNNIDNISIGTKLNKFKKDFDKNLCLINYSNEKEELIRTKLSTN